MTSKQLQQIINDLDEARLWFPRDGDNVSDEHKQLGRSLTKASYILCQLTDEQIALLESE